MPPKSRIPKSTNVLTLQRRTIPELRAEVKRRGLSLRGIRLKSQLIARISEDNAKILAASRQKALDAIVPFSSFPKLPVEIRLMIWELSLPGPRVLTVIDYRRFEDRLLFPKEDNLPNPAALSACRESRAVALKRYRLCFGAPNLYADLPGGDILHFGVHWKFAEWVFGKGGILLNWVELPNGDADILYEEFDDLEEHKPWKHQTLSAAVVADLMAVKRIAVRKRIWEEYCDTITHTGLSGCDLRIDLKGFPHLESVMLVEGGSEDVIGFYTAAGYIELKDKLGDQYGYKGSYDDWTTEFAQQACEEFRETQLSEAEKTNGVPEIKVVKANRIPRIPGDHWERDLGKKYASNDLPDREEPPRPRQPPRLQ